MGKPSRKDLLELMKPEDRAKSLASSEKREASVKFELNSEWMGLGELGVYFGWEAIQAVLDDVITIEQANVLVLSARSVHAEHVYDQAVAMRAGVSNVKGAFQKLMKPYLKEMMVNNG